MIEVLSRLRLPIAPEQPDEVARLVDITFASGVGIFWFEHESGNLYFVTDSGMTPPFEVEDGNLYYIVQGT